MLRLMTHRILVVDDEPAVIDLLAYNLRKAHYEVFVATDGRQALQLASEANPDLILLDLMLPEVDGLDVCRKLRMTSEVPIIMITALGEETDRVVGHQGLDVCERILQLARHFRCGIRLRSCGQQHRTADQQASEHPVHHTIRDNHLYFTQ